MNTETMPLWLLAALGLEKPEARLAVPGPIEQKLRLARLEPLDAGEIERYRVAQARDHSSWFAPAALWYRRWRSCARGLLETTFSVAFVVGLLAFAVTCVAAIASASFPDARAFAYLAVKVSAVCGLMLPVITALEWALQKIEEVRFRIASWRGEPLDCVRHRLPRQVLDIAARARAAAPEARLVVEELRVDEAVVDPILWAVRGSERIPLAVWLGDHVVASA